MNIVEQRVSAGNRDLFDFDEFMSRPLFAHLAHAGPRGPCESPIWFHWDGQAVWIIGGTSFPENLKRDARCALGIVDWNQATGLLHHVGLRGSAEVLPFDPCWRVRFFVATSAPRKSLGTLRFDDVLAGEAVAEMVRFVPDTVVMRDQSYRL